jgi:hypothetical protein
MFAENKTEIELAERRPCLYIRFRKFSECEPHDELQIQPDHIFGFQLRPLHRPCIGPRTDHLWLTSIQVDMTTNFESC